jgi:hypothetical protein
MIPARSFDVCRAPTCHDSLDRRLDNLSARGEASAVDGECAPESSGVRFPASSKRKIEIFDSGPTTQSQKTAWGSATRQGGSAKRTCTRSAVIKISAWPDQRAHRHAGTPQGLRPCRMRKAAKNSPLATYFRLCDWGRKTSRRNVSRTRHALHVSGWRSFCGT